MLTERAREHVMCHVSGVKYPVLHVRCQVSAFIFFFFLDKMAELVVGGFVISGAYPL